MNMWTAFILLIFGLLIPGLLISRAFEVRSPADGLDGGILLKQIERFVIGFTISLIIVSIAYLIVNLAVTIESQEALMAIICGAYLGTTILVLDKYFGIDRILSNLVR